MSKPSSPPVRVGQCCPLSGLISPRLFKALGDPNRVTLLLRLAECCRPCTVSELSCCLTVDVSVASRHLALLREAGVLAAQKRGKQVYYSVRYDELIRTLRQITEALEKCCAAEAGETSRCAPPFTGDEP